MKTKTRKALRWITALAGVLLVALLAFTAVRTFSRYVLVEGDLYPRDAQLDLRDSSLTGKTYEKLQRKLPDSTILWSVPFQAQTQPSNAEEIAVRDLTDLDLEMLKYFANLQVLDGRNCGNLDALVQAQQMYPDVQVLYTVTINGTDYPQDAEHVEASGLTDRDVALMAYLPQLSEVTVSGCENYALLQQVQQQNPQWNLTYTVSLGGEAYAGDTKDVTVRSATEAELDSAMKGFTKLESVTLIDPEAPADYLVSLREQYPEVEIRWELEIQGVTYTDDLTEVDISHMPLESLKQAETIGSYFPDLEKLIVDSGSIDNDTMAAFRDNMRPNYKVVWTVVCGTGRFGSFEVRTDETTFMPLKHNMYYFLDEDAVNLRYCEDMICIDLGHMAIKDVSFVEYMPHLKYLILAHTTVMDITPLSTCKELVFLEIDWTAIKDYTPLLGCTALEDLNLGLTYGDPTPISQMTWLKNLWWKDAGYKTRLLLEENLPDTYLMLNPPYTVGWGWRELQNYYDMRDILGMPYMK